METESQNGLSPCLLYILTLARDAEDTSDKTLARLSGKPPGTIQTYFKRMFEITGLHDRGLLVRRAEIEGWIPPPQ